MQSVTDFGDQAVILPVALCVALTLAVCGWWRGLVAWAAVVPGSLVTMAGLKIAGLAVADGGLPFSPSGHVASTCVVYGGLAMMLLRDVAPLPLRLLAPLSTAVLIGASRIVLRAHDLTEVVIGALVGLAGAILLAVLSGRPPHAAALPLMGSALVPAVLFHGSHLPIEQMIRLVFAGG